jgi:hypothetical protein
MRSDLDAVRERHVLRETREELFQVQSGDWGWAKAYVQTMPHHLGDAPGEPRARYFNARGRQMLLVNPPGPGTADGGF